MKMTRDAAAETGKPLPVRVMAEPKSKPADSASNKKRETARASAKHAAFSAWRNLNAYPESELRYHDIAPVCRLPDFRLPGTPGKAINSTFPDLAAKLSAGGIGIRLLCRLPQSLRPTGCEGSHFHVLCDDLPLRDIVRATGMGQEELEVKSGLSSADITVSFKAPARLPRLLSIAEALGIRIDYMVTRPRSEPVIYTRLELLDMRAPPTGGNARVLWPGAELSDILTNQEFTRSGRLSADMLGLPDLAEWEPETICGINRGIGPFGAELHIAVLDHQAGWLLGNERIGPETLPALIGAGPELSERNISSLPDPELLGLSGFNAALYERGISHRYVLRDIRNRRIEVFDDGPVATAAQFRELARRRDACDQA